MKIMVMVKPNARHNAVKQLSDCHYEVRVKAPGRENKANLEVVKVMAGHFNISPSDVIIKSGYKSRQKLLIINK